MDTNPHCHRPSKQARTTLRQLDDVELLAARHFIEKGARFCFASPAHRLSEVPLGDRMLVVVWRYEGEVTGKERRKVIVWDSAILKERPERHTLNRDLRNHIVAGIVVSLLSAACTFGYSHRHWIWEVVTPAQSQK